MNKYELVYIIAPDVDEEGRKALRERVNDLIVRDGGEVVKVEDWGKRRLAYAIDYKTEGWYVLVNFNGNSEMPREIERNLGIIDQVIRYQVIRVLEKRSNVKPRAPRPVQNAPEAPAAEEAEPKAEE